MTIINATASSSDLLKEWEVRHNAFVQFQSQFLSFTTIGATSFTAGFYYVSQVKITDDPARFIASMSILICVGLLYSIGNFLSLPILEGYRLRLNTLAGVLGLGVLDEVRGLKRASIIAGIGSMLTVVIVILFGLAKLV